MTECSDPVVGGPVDIGKIETHAVDINSRSKGTFMRSQIFARTLFFLVILVAIFSEMHQSGNANGTGTTLFCNPTPTPAQDAVNRVFAVTQQVLRRAFDAAKARGERNQTINLGQERSLDVSAQTLRGTESLKLRVKFFSPLDQARGKGLEFGRPRARPRTPRDRRALEESSLSTILDNRNQVTFSVWLDQPRDRDASIPSFSYALLDKDGNRITPTSEPGSLLLPERDLPAAAAMAETGSPLIFPVFNGAIPNLTTRMNTMVLIVRVESDEHKLQFQLM
jgi:hypothetical protein